MKVRLISIAAAFVIASAAPSLAQRAPITQGATSGDLAVTTSQLRQSVAEMRVQINNLRADNSALSGQVETLEFLLSQSRDEINRMQEDDRQISELISRLEETIQTQEARIAALETRPAVAAPAAPRSFTSEAGAEAPDLAVETTEGGADAPASTGSLGTLPASALPGDAGPLFADAKSKLLRYDYAGAESSFRSFLQQFGDDPQAGEAQYWLGEVLYQQEAYAESGAAYTDMIRNYPEDPRAPDALVKLARSLRLVGDPSAACSALAQLPRRYPEASGVTKNLAAVERSRSGCS